MPDHALPRRLYHYCCHHSVAAILADRGTLRPPAAEIMARAAELAVELVGEPFAPPRVVWLTDLDVTEHDDRRALGLAGTRTACDRTAFRFVVPRLAVIEPWRAWAARVAYPLAHLLDVAAGALPERWFVAEEPIRGARLDERYGGV
jgi:hypothetical protein